MIPEQIFRRRINSRHSESVDKLVLNPDQWYTVAHKKHNLQIKDICELKSGAEVKLLLLGNNWKTIALENKIKKKIYNPIDFFEHNFGTYIHDRDLTGTLILHTADTDILIEKFEFDIEYDSDRWYPLTDGYLLTNNSDIHWTELPLDTGIGYGGPAVFKSVLIYLPSIIINLPHNNLK